MTLYLPETLAALGLIAGFSLLGDVLLWRRATTLASFSESWLIGLGAMSAVLFPLSALAGRYALTAVLWLLLIGLVANAVTFRRRPAVNAEPERASAPAVVMVLIIGIITMIWAAYNLERSLLWDGFQIWATKAQLLFHLGRLAPDPLPETFYLLGRLESYPPAVPLVEALAARVVGSFDFNATKPIFLFFLISLLLAVYSGARTRLSAPASHLVVLLTLATPGIVLHYSAGGYADLPLAAFVAAGAAAALRPVGNESRRALPLLMASCAFVKSEGIFVVAVFAGLTIAHWFRSPEPVLVRIRRSRTAIAIIASMVALRFGYLEWIGSKPSGQFHSFDLEGLSAAAENSARVLTLAGEELLNMEQWGVLWVVFVLAAAYVLMHGRTGERHVTAGVMSVLIVYTGIFLFTKWVIDIHIPNAYPRLLTQIAPVAWICGAVAFAEATRDRDTTAA